MMKKAMIIVLLAAFVITETACVVHVKERRHRRVVSRPPAHGIVVY